jgi:hypothetical protein
MVQVRFTLAPGPFGWPGALVMPRPLTPPHSEIVFLPLRRSTRRAAAQPAQQRKRDTDSQGNHPHV